MKTVARMKNRVQKYLWGSRTFIPELLGRKTPSDSPWAELWLGAHPKAPSMVEVGGRWVSLLDLIEASPQEVLGTAVLRRFGRQLPYLFKVLAAVRPLSIQAHPNLEEAREGFARENRQGIALDDPRRNYRDDNHKPELICALTDFWALKGFRHPEALIAALQPFGGPELLPELDLLRQHPDSGGLKLFFANLMALDGPRRRQLLAAAVKWAQQRSERDDACRWVLELERAYPGDIGVLAPLMMNLVCLKPGEAMFLEAGQLHAYLAGNGIELMANSDNVLRGGLTPKHIDVAELLKVLNFTTGAPRILHPEKVDAGEAVYVQPAAEFSLSVISLAKDHTRARSTHGAEILLCTRGCAVISDDGGSRLSFGKGGSVLVPASVRRYTLQGEGVLYSAHVPPTDGDRQRAGKSP